jgi:hypothetical protein
MFLEAGIFCVEAVEVLVGQAQCLPVYQIKKFGYAVTLIP